MLSVRACSGGSLYWALRVIKTQLGLKRPLYLLTRTFVKKTKLLSHAVYTLVEMIPIVYLIALGFSKLSMYLSASSASISRCKNILLKKKPPSVGPLYIHAFLLLNLLLPMYCSRQFTDVRFHITTVKGYVM